MGEEDYADYVLVVPFDRDSADFARGVEVGVLYQRLLTEPRPVSATVHGSNAEMVLRLADAVGASASAVDLGQDWMSVTFS